MKLEEAQAIATELARRLLMNGHRARVMIVGSVRRETPTVNDIDLLVVAKPPATLTQMSWRAPRAGDRVTVTGCGTGTRHRACMAKLGSKAIHVDVFATAPSEKPYALFHYTGSKSYNIRTRALAKKRGWLLNQYGLFVRDSDNPGTRVRATVRSEKNLATLLGVTYRHPRDRL